MGTRQSQEATNKTAPESPLVSPKQQEPPLKVFGVRKICIHGIDEWWQRYCTSHDGQPSQTRQMQAISSRVRNEIQRVYMERKKDMEAAALHKEQQQSAKNSGKEKKKQASGLPAAFVLRDFDREVAEQLSLGSLKNVPLDVFVTILTFLPLHDVVHHVSLTSWGFRFGLYPLGSSSNYWEILLRQSATPFATNFENQKDELSYLHSENALQTLQEFHCEIPRLEEELFYPPLSSKSGPAQQPQAFVKIQVQYCCCYDMFKQFFSGRVERESRLNDGIARIRSEKKKLMDEQTKALHKMRRQFKKVHSSTRIYSGLAALCGAVIALRLGWIQDTGTLLSSMSGWVFQKVSWLRGATAHARASSFWQLVLICFGLPFILRSSSKTGSPQKPQPFLVQVFGAYIGVVLAVAGFSFSVTCAILQTAFCPCPLGAFQTYWYPESILIRVFLMLMWTPLKAVPFLAHFFVGSPIFIAIMIIDFILKNFGGFLVLCLVGGLLYFLFLHFLSVGISKKEVRKALQDVTLTGIRYEWVANGCHYVKRRLTKTEMESQERVMQNFLKKLESEKKIWGLLENAIVDQRRSVMQQMDNSISDLQAKITQLHPPPARRSEPPPPRGCSIS